MTKRYFDLAIIVPLAEEFEQLRKILPAKSEDTEGAIYYAEIDTGLAEISAVAVLQDEMGKAAATRAADYIISQFDIGVMVVIGIAGGLSDDVSVGEVCVSGTVIDVLDNAKVADGKSGAKITFDPSYYSTDPLLTFCFKYFRISIETKAQFEEWQLQCYYDASEKISGEFIGRQSKNELISIPDIHDGTIICGAVSKSQIYNSSLKNIDRKPLAIETESGGPFHSADRAAIPLVAIRGVCDYADKNKSQLEADTGGHLRGVAARNAVSLLKAQFHNPQFRKYLTRRRDAVLGTGAPLFPAISEEALLDTAKKAVADQIDAQLRTLSVEYQTKAKGFRLPLPRIRPSEANVGVSAKLRPKDEPIAILEALVSERATAIEVPRTYPDSSLPWIIAAEVSLIEIEGKTPLPIVIQGDAIAPPSHGLARQIGDEVAKAVGCPSAIPVFIVDGMPLGSKSRSDFLISELEKFPSAKIVFVNKPDANFARKSQLMLTLGANQYVITEISFAEMSNFIRRNFNLPDQEAGVIALRLRDTFERFYLSAHPSYFAGVAGETLMSLLHANRRAELIQLAVDGFLSFVVANDQNKVRLSRTTRARFLRKLIYNIKVEKRSYDRAGLVAFAEQHATENDFDIDPIQFVQTFVDRGILHFSEYGVEVTLQFMEAYLLALELTSRPQDAKFYFDPTQDEFDFLTFDIYCEIGPSTEIVSEVARHLGAAAAEIANGLPDTHILLTDEIRPAIVDKRERLRALEQRLQRAFDDVAQNRPNSEEKQQLIDATAHFEERARYASEEVSRSDTHERAKEIDALSKCFRQWVIATIALGAGSEHLSGQDKRNLAQVIVTSTSVLLDAWMRAFPKDEFRKLKSEIVSDESIRAAFHMPDDQKIDESLREFVSAVVDTYEFSLLSHPIRVMFEQIADAAGQKVLATSISKVSSNGLIENLITASWAAEVDAARSKGKLLGAIRELPPTPFLRFSLSQHYMVRVYWNHWEHPNQMALLEAAETALEPLGGGKFDRMALKRLTGRNVGGDDGDG